MSCRPVNSPARIPDLPQHQFDAPLRRLMELGDAEPESVYTQIARTLQSQNQGAEPLIAIALDHSYIHYADRDEDDPRNWTRVHAVRVLERMGNTAHAAIEPFLPLLGSDDDWLREEMPIFYSIIGEPAIAPLTRTVEDKKVDSEVRCGAADALVEIAEKRPETRAATIALLERGLANDNEDETLVADFIVCLMNLGAKESYPQIRAAYEQNSVDEFVVGLDEVEEHFGLPVTVSPHAGETEDNDELLSRGFVSEFDESAELEAEPEPQTPFIAENKVGRNEPCPCGSGQKYKKCCGR